MVGGRIVCMKFGDYKNIFCVQMIIGVDRKYISIYNIVQNHFDFLNDLVVFIKVQRPKFIIFQSV